MRPLSEILGGIESEWSRRFGPLMSRASATSSNASGPDTPPPLCPRCKDAGYIGRDTLRETERGILAPIEPCPDCGWRRLYDAAGIPASYATAGERGLPEVAWFDPARLADAAPLEKVVAYCDALDHAIAEGYGLYLWGPKGSGKTHLAAMVAVAAIRRMTAVRFVTASDLTAVVKRTYGKGEQQPDVLLRYINVPLLVLDDFAAEGSAHDLGLIFRLTDARTRARKPTIYTSKYAPDDLKGALVRDNLELADSVEDRVLGRAIPVEVRATVSGRIAQRDEFARRIGL